MLLRATKPKKTITYNKSTASDFMTPSVSVENRDVYIFGDSIMKHIGGAFCNAFDYSKKGANTAEIQKQIRKALSIEQTSPRVVLINGGLNDGCHTTFNTEFANNVLFNNLLKPLIDAAYEHDFNYFWYCCFR